jgi:hypothetical protein
MIAVIAMVLSSGNIAIEEMRWQARTNARNLGHRWGGAP